MEEQLYLRKVLLSSFTLFLLFCISSCIGEKPIRRHTLNIFFYGMQPNEAPVILKVDDKTILEDVWAPRRMYKKFVSPISMSGEQAHIYFSVGKKDTSFVYEVEGKNNYIWLGYSMKNQFLFSKEDSVTFRSSGGNDVVTYD